MEVDKIIYASVHKFVETDRLSFTVRMLTFERLRTFFYRVFPSATALGMYKEIDRNIENENRSDSLPFSAELM